MYEVNDVDFSYFLVSIPKAKAPVIDMHSGKFRLGPSKEKDSYTAGIAKLFEIIRECGISLKRRKIIDFQIHFPQH